MAVRHRGTRLLQVYTAVCLSCVGMQLGSRLAGVIGKLADEASAAGVQCASEASPATNCWRFQLVLSYDDSAASSFDDVAQGFTILRERWLGNATLAAAGGGLGVMYKARSDSFAVLGTGGAYPLFTWSEAAENSFPHALSTVFAASGIPVVRVARNARAFDDSGANFGWVGTMSTASNLGTNWGKQYVCVILMPFPSLPTAVAVLITVLICPRYNLDFEWIMARQTSFGASNTSTVNKLVAGAVWPGFNDTNVPVTWNGGNTRLIARDVAEGALVVYRVLSRLHLTRSARVPCHAQGTQ